MRALLAPRHSQTTAGPQTIQRVVNTGQESPGYDTVHGKRSLPKRTRIGNMNLLRFFVFYPRLLSLSVYRGLREEDEDKGRR